MQGGTISGNTSRGNYGNGANGGGVCIDGGTFTMRGGSITGNTTSGQGGGVYVAGTFIKNGGVISGNNAESGDRNTSAKQGHALYNSSDNRWRNATAGADDNSGGYGFWMND